MKLIFSQLKRQHSVDLLNAASPSTRKSPASNTPNGGSTPPHNLDPSITPATLPSANIFELEAPRAFDEANIGSPLKKQRASITGLDDEGIKRRLGLGLAGLTGDLLAQIDPVQVNEEPDLVETGTKAGYGYDELLRQKNATPDYEQMTRKNLASDYNEQLTRKNPGSDDEEL